jgi:hypothetical protein
MSKAVKIIMRERPVEKMAFCPALRREREVCVLSPNFWYSARVAS